MSMTLVKGMQSEIFVPITPPMVWTPVTKELKDMTVALATAAVRKAKNKAEFLEKVKKETDLDIRVIDGDREAFYDFYGVKANRRGNQSHPPGGRAPTCRHP